MIAKRSYSLIIHTYIRTPDIDIQAAVSVIGQMSNSSKERKEYIIDISQPTLRDIVFSGNYDYVNFYGTHFISPIFRDDTSFRSADFSETFIESMKADNVSLEKANFKKSVIINSTLNKVVLNNACFSEAEFSGGTVVEECDFSRASLNSLKIGQPIPIKPRNKNSKAEHAIFDEESKFSRVCFDEANLTDSQIDNVVFECSSFRKVNLENSKVRGVTFKDSILSQACLKYVFFGKTRKAGVGFEDTDLQGADLSGAIDIIGNSETLESMKGFLPYPW